MDGVQLHARPAVRVSPAGYVPLPVKGPVAFDLDTGLGVFFPQQVDQLDEPLHFLDYIGVLTLDVALDVIVDLRAALGRRAAWVWRLAHFGQVDRMGAGLEVEQAAHGPLRHWTEGGSAQVNDGLLFGLELGLDGTRVELQGVAFDRGDGDFPGAEGTGVEGWAISHGGQTPHVAGFGVPRLRLRLGGRI